MTTPDNFTWAKDLAEQRLMAVERKEVNVSIVDPQKLLLLMALQDMPSLPAEVWCIIAEMLASENDLSAISRLNVSCFNIYHATLPILYEKVRLRSLEELESVVASGTAKGWQYVK
jgi:hypothetical protein